MKKRKKIYNWHFWIPNYKIQIVIDEHSYGKANKRIREIFNDYEKIQFQFGQLV